MVTGPFVLPSSPNSSSTSTPPTPISFFANGRWLLKILAREGRFVFGLYRRQMKAISLLGSIDRLFGVSANTRNWNTITAIAKAIDDDREPGPAPWNGPLDRSTGSDDSTRSS